MASQNAGKSLPPISGRGTPAPDTATEEARPPAITIGKRSTATTDDFSPGPKPHLVGTGRLPGPDFSTMHKSHGDKGRGAGDQPGPGSYDPKDVIRSGWPAGITMGVPRHGDKPLATPGPGNYEVPDPRTESPAFSIGRKSSVSHRRSRDIPGPGSYFVTRHGSGTATDSMLTFSQGSPPAVDPDNVSGVSSVSGRLRELPEHRRRRAPRDAAPGPASYNVNSRFTSSTPPAFTFGSHLPHSIFDAKAASLTPGPGTYSLDASSTAGRSSPSFTIQGRDSTPDTMMLRQSAATPGPGAYEQRSYAVEGPALSLGKRLQMPRQPYIPGPGAYHQEGKPAGPSFSLFRRNAFFSRPDRGTPGPGSYYYNAALSRPASPAFSMSTKSAPPAAGVRRQDTAPGPGPGSYNLRTTFEGPYFTLLSRTAPPSRKSFETPGPGRYNLDSFGRPDSPAFSFGCKTPSEVNVSPGPGQYDTQKPIGRPLSFSFGMRPPQSKRVMGPGPGTYEPTSTVSGPSHSLHGRFRTSYTATAPSKYFPGPGTYNIKMRLQGPAFTLPCRLDGRRDAWRSQTPGPGAYELGSRCVSHSPPRFSLGQRLDPKDRERRPGPGSYNLPLRSSAPAFSMLSRF